MPRPIGGPSRIGDSSNLCQNNEDMLALLRESLELLRQQQTTMESLHEGHVRLEARVGALLEHRGLAEMTNVDEQIQDRPIDVPHTPENALLSAGKKDSPRHTVEHAVHLEGDPTLPTNVQPNVSADTVASSSISSPRKKKKKKTTQLSVSSAGSQSKAPEQNPGHDVPETCAARLRRLCKSTKFEVFMGVMTFSNLALIAWEQQLLGLGHGADLGMEDISDSARRTREIVTSVERIFLIVYFIEMGLRVWALGAQYFREVLNRVDAFILGACTLEAVLVPFVDGTPSMRVFRQLRLLRVFRLTRLVRFFSAFQDLYLILQTVISSFLALLWSTVFLVFCICGSTLVVCQLVETFLQGDSQDVQTRKWVYENFGTFTRALLSLFEAAFSTNWVTFARPMIYRVHWAFMFFWFVYVVGVNFALIRIVSALFLKEALSVARIEEEKQSAARIKQRQQVSSVLFEIFSLADTSGDQLISRGEFEALMQRQDVTSLWGKMDIEADEAQMLFDILCEDDEAADFEELLNGATQLKNSVRTVETIKIMHKLLHLERAIKDGFSSARKGH